MSKNDNAAIKPLGALKSTSPYSPVYTLYGYKFTVPAGYRVMAFLQSDRSSRLVLLTNHGAVTIRACHRCKRYRFLDHFYSDRGSCRDCHKLAVIKWQDKHPDLVKIYKRKANQRYRDRCKANTEKSC